MLVTNEKELGEAIKNGQDYIEVEGDLVNKVFKIKASGKVVWGIIGAAIVGIICGTILGVGKTFPLHESKYLNKGGNKNIPTTNSSNGIKNYNLSKDGNKVILTKIK